MASSLQSQHRSSWQDRQPAARCALALGTAALAAACAGGTPAGPSPAANVTAPAIAIVSEKPASNASPTAEATLATSIVGSIGGTTPTPSHSTVLIYGTVRYRRGLAAYPAGGAVVTIVQRETGRLVAQTTANAQGAFEIPIARSEGACNSGSNVLYLFPCKTFVVRAKWSTLAGTSSGFYLRAYSSLQPVAAIAQNVIVSP